MQNNNHNYFLDNKNMKRLFTLLASAVFTVASYAQYNTGDIAINESTVYYGARIGIDFSRLSGDFDCTGSRTGLTLGAVLGLHISEATPICLETGIYYTERGAKSDDKRISLSYLELPLLIKYGFEVGNNMAVLPYVGPYFSLGVGGKIKSNVEVTSSYNEAFNHPDMGMKFGCGFEYNHLYIEGGYQLGIANISKEKMSTIHGNAWFINIGFNI